MSRQSIFRQRGTETGVDVSDKYSQDGDSSTLLLAQSICIPYRPEPACGETVSFGLQVTGATGALPRPRDGITSPLPQLI